MKRRKKTKKSGNSLEVVSSSDEAEDADIMVCRVMTDPLYFPDNHVGFCADCHQPIQWRPHAPKTPKRVCDDCAFPVMAKEAEKGELKIQVTEKTAAEVFAFIARKMREN
jgi:predicted amidophosphoribosyltransferase